MELTQILTIAAKEFRDRMRNRWVLAVALVFTVFSLVIAYFGGAQQGTVGFRSHRVHHRQPGQPGDLPDSADRAAAGL
jgi:ABC-type transport system involved in multi-copper enzyme maturation permease subunit